MDENSKKNFFKDKNFWMGVIIGVVVIAIIMLIISGVQAMASGNMSLEKAKAKVTSYVNDNLLGGQATATIDQITSAGKDIYKLKFNVNGKSIDSYMTKNGKLFFPEAYDMASSTVAASQDGTQTQATAITKNDKPKVELFIMSYCPYGTQIEKGILPAVQALGNKIDFNLKFVDYAMHGQQELDENLREYCIDKEQNNKLYSYLTCFLKSSDSASCLKSAGVNQGKLDSCVKSADKQFKVTEQFTNKTNWNGNYPPFDTHKADNTKYGVQGSPTLVINGVQAQSARDSASLLKTICSAFNNQPDICSTAKLSSASPAAGFGEGTATAGTATAGCAE